jgi:hypothetical protein
MPSMAWRSRDVLGRRAAAAAGDVDEAGLRELAQQRGHDLGRLVEAGVDIGFGRPAFG